MFGRSAVAALLLIAGATPACADFASEALLHEFVRNIDESPDWSAIAGAVRSQGLDTFGERLVVSRQDPDVTVSIDRLRLRDLREGADGGFSAAEIEVTGTTFASEDADVAIPTASVREVAVPGPEGLVYDPRRLMTFISRLYSILAEAQFSQFSVPEMIAVPREPAAPGSGEPPVEGRLIYRNLTIPTLRDGIIASSQVGPITFEGRDANGEVRFEIQSVSSERIDVASAAHLLDEANYRGGRGDGVRRPLVSRIGYSGLSVVGPDGATVRLGGFAVEGIEAQQPEKPFAPLWDRILDPAVPEQARSELALDAIYDMASAWRVDAVTLDDFAVEAPQDAASAKLGSFTLSGLSAEGIDSVVVKGLRGQGPDGFAQLDGLELAGLLFPDTDALIRFAALENRASTAKHNQTMRDAFAGLPRLSHLAVQGLSAGTSPSDAVRMALFSVDFRAWNALFAGETDLRIEGLEVPVHMLQLAPDQLQVMNTLGYDRLVLGMSFSDRWSPQTGADNGTWTLSLKDGARVDLTYALSGVTEAWMLAATAAAAKGESGKAALMTMLNGLRLDQASVTVTDLSLLDRAFAVAAQKQGLSVNGPAYREQMRGALPFLLSAALPAEISKLITAPLQAFMAGRQKLVAEINPPAPVPLPELAAGFDDPTGLVTRLGMTVRSEAPVQ